MQRFSSSPNSFVPSARIEGRPPPPLPDSPLLYTTDLRWATLGMPLSEAYFISEVKSAYVMHFSFALCCFENLPQQTNISSWHSYQTCSNCKCGMVSSIELPNIFPGCFVHQKIGLGLIKKSRAPWVDVSTPSRPAQIPTGFSACTARRSTGYHHNWDTREYSEIRALRRCEVDGQPPHESLELPPTKYLQRPLGGVILWIFRNQPFLNPFFCPRVFQTQSFCFLLFPMMPSRIQNSLHSTWAFYI